MKIQQNRSDEMLVKFGPDYLTAVRGNRTYKIDKHEITNLLDKIYDEDLKDMAFHVSEYTTLKDLQNIRVKG